MKSWYMVFIALLVLVLEFSVVSGQPQYYNYSNVGSGNNSFPFNVAAGKEVQYLFLANDFNQPTPCPAGQQITTLYLFMVGAGTGTFTNLTIKLGQTDSTFLPVGVMYTGPMDTVYYRASGSLTSTATSWMSITLDRPYPYNPTRSLIVDVAQCGVAALTGMTVRNNTQAIPPYKRTYINNSGSCVYVYSGQDGSVLNCGFDVVPAQPQYCNYDTTANPNSFPLNQPSGKMCQYLILPGDFNRPSPAPSGNITSFSLRMAAALGPYTYSAFYILMGQTTLTSLPTSTFYTGPMDTVYRRASVTLAGVADRWLTFTLDVPRAYDPTRSLVIQVEQCGAPGATGYSLSQVILTGNRRSYSTVPCPWAYSGQDARIMCCGVNVVPVGPTCNTFARTWAPAGGYPDLPDSTFFQAAAWLGDTLFVQAPSNTGLPLARIFKYVHGGGWSTGVPIPAAKVGGTLTNCANKLYYIGGGTAAITTGSTDVYEFNPATQVWATKASMPVALAAHGAVCWGDSVIFVVGGPYTGPSTNLDIQVYRPAANVWSTITASLPTGQGRRTFACGISGNKIVISSGYSGSAYLKSTFVGTINSASSITWAAAPDVPIGHTGLSRPGGTAFGDKFFLVCGEQSITGYSDTTHVFSISSNSWAAIITGKPIKMSNIFNAVTAKCFNDTVRVYVPGGYGTATGTGTGVGQKVFDVISTGSLVGVSEPVAEVPGEFRLEQNYPNPFNPTSTISYQIPTQSHVTLKVYDVLGREVVTLVNGVEERGYKSVQWNASNFASGMYFYRLEAGEFMQTRKMLLLK